MGKGGIRASCRATLLIVSGIVLGAACLAAFVGGALFASSKAFHAVGTAHVTAISQSQTAAKLDHKFSSLRKQSAQKAVVLMRAAYGTFATAGALAAISLAILVASCVLGARPRARMAPPAITASPGSYPSQRAPSDGAPAGQPTPPAATSPTPPPRVVSPSPTSPTPPPEVFPTPPPAAPQTPPLAAFPIAPPEELPAAQSESADSRRPSMFPQL